jgi:glycosyltransferase involved in cell wall biosynthesis
MDISVVIPAYNEVESIPELSQWLERVMNENNFSYQVIFIDDGSNDGTWAAIEKLAQANSSVEGIKFRRNYGKSAALNEGFAAAKGDVVITMDADMQDSPNEIPGLHKMVMHDDFDLVSGWKKKRYDPIAKTLPSKFFNWVTTVMTGIRLHDFNCGLKAYKNEVVKNIEVYGEMHRYIPLIAKSAGFAKIGEKVVEHRKRQYGTTKFGIERFVNGFLDLLSILFVSRFGKQPMHLFGTLGTLMFILGFLISLWLGIDKLFLDIEGQLITSKPLFYIALTTMILGTQLFLAGFIGEMVSRTSPTRNQYEVEKRIAKNGLKTEV